MFRLPLIELMLDEVEAGEEAAVDFRDGGGRGLGFGEDDFRGLEAFFPPWGVGGTGDFGEEFVVLVGFDEVVLDAEGGDFFDGFAVVGFGVNEDGQRGEEGIGPDGADDGLAAALGEFDFHHEDVEEGAIGEHFEGLGGPYGVPHVMDAAVDDACEGFDGERVAFQEEDIGHGLSGMAGLGGRVWFWDGIITNGNGGGVQLKRGSFVKGEFMPVDGCTGEEGW